MRPYLLFFLSLFTTCALAQKVHQITLKPEAISLPNRAFHIATVLDQRSNKQSIGFAQKGLGNKRFDAQFIEALDIHLLKTFNQLIPSSKTTPIIARIHNLYVSERTTAFKEVGKAEVKIEFLTADTTKTWGLFFAEVEQKGVDVTNKHDTRIIQALTNCLEQLVERWTDPPVPAINFALATFDPSQGIKEGLYPTFSSFANQTPLNDIKYQIRPNEKKPNWATLHRLYDGDKIKDMFGVYDGTDFYLSAVQYSYETHMVKAHYTGKYFYFEDKVSDTGATLAFGLLGALASHKTKGLVLNTETGLVSEMSRDFLALALKDYPDLKKHYNKSKKQLADKKEVLRMLNEVLAKE